MTFEDQLKLKYILKCQHEIILSLRHKNKNLRADIEDLKSRIENFINLGDDEVKALRLDIHTREVIKSRDEAMNKVRKLEALNAELLRR